MLTDTLESTFTAKSIGSVDRVEKISPKELYKEYIEPGLPVIITDAINKWPALGKFTPEFFREKYGHVKKEVKGVSYTMEEFIPMMYNSKPGNVAPYPFNFNIEEVFPELKEDIKPEILFNKIERVNHPLLPRFMMHGTMVYEIFFGGNGAQFPYLHVDALLLHTQLTQLYGSKELVFFPPDQTKYMYPSAESPKYSQVNLFEPDFKKFPLFREAKPIRATIKQGETIFFPAGWWHSTQAHEPNITVTKVILTRGNWNKYIDEECTIWKTKSSFMGPAIKAYGKMLGQVMNLQERFA